VQGVNVGKFCLLSALVLILVFVLVLVLTLKTRAESLEQRPLLLLPPK